jgi:hypothetical protein
MKCPPQTVRKLNLSSGESHICIRAQIGTRIKKPCRLVFGQFPPKNRQIKYNLIYRLRRKGFNVITRQKTIFCEYLSSPDDTIEIKRLRNEFHFSVQFEIR